MSFCELLFKVLFSKVKVCEDCEGWFLYDNFNIASDLCHKCDKLQQSQIFDHSRKRLAKSNEDLTKEYKKKKCQTGKN